jgi:hypothetical protein
MRVARLCTQNRFHFIRGSEPPYSLQNWTEADCKFDPITTVADDCLEERHCQAQCRGQKTPLYRGSKNSCDALSSLEPKLRGCVVREKIKDLHNEIPSAILTSLETQVAQAVCS